MSTINPVTFVLQVYLNGLSFGVILPAELRRPRSDCPIARSLELFGDRWTLLVIRDLLHGKTKFRDFLSSSEGIPTNILSARLKLLEREGLVESALYQAHPPRLAYTLTAKGRSLAGIVRVIADWGEKNFPGTKRRTLRSTPS